MSECEEIEDDGGKQCEGQIFDTLPTCKCGGEVIFIGHEQPCGKWREGWKAYFKCLGCNRVWYENRKINIIFGGISKR